MKQINPIVFLVPVGMTIFFLSLHIFLTWYNWRKELRQDEKKKAIVDRLLSDDPGCENEEVLHPAKWQSFEILN